MSLKKKVDVLVIGAGPAGTIAAAILHKAGLDVQIVEKMKFPRFVIGESLLPRCMEALEEAGMLEAVAAKGFQRKEGAKFVMNGKVCDFSFTNQFTKGWNWTYQVPRAEFDKALADSCEERGISISYETEVTAVEIHEDGSSTNTIQLKDGSNEIIEARFIVDGSGYGRVIPTLFGLTKPSTQYARKALFAHIEDPRRMELEQPNRIVAIVHQPATWIWAIPFSNGNTSLGFVGSPEFFEPLTGSTEDQLRTLIASEPVVAERFKNCKMLWEPKTLQGWSATTENFYGKGYVLTGNVTEFLDPIFSSGVTLATVSAQKAANLIIRQLQGGEEIDWATEYMQVMETGVDVFRTFVNRWYDGTLFKIFFSENRSQDMLNQICSVLAGYVWDKSNPFVKNAEKMVGTLARYIEAMAPKPEEESVAESSN